MGSSRIQELLRSKLAIRNQMAKEFLAEFLGTFILIIFGDGSVAQSVLTNGQKADFFSINWGWGIGVILGVLVSGGVSGGHLNPAVSLAMAVFGKFSWMKVPVYMVAQYLGSFAAALLLLGIYADALDAFDGGNRTMATAGIFATYPGYVINANQDKVESFLTNANGVSDQVVGTMLLLICVCAITDPRNMEVPKALIPLFVGFAVLNIGICFGFNSGYAINPARDLAPRLVTLIAGWGDAPFTASTLDGIAWWWVPIVATHIGGILGVIVYLFFVELHHPDAEEYQLPQVQSQDSVAITLATNTTTTVHPSNTTTFTTSGLGTVGTYKKQNLVRPSPSSDWIPYQ